MSKYQINYNRSMPDHRVPFDYHFVKNIKGPLDYLKQYKSGWNNSWVKYYHIHLSGVYLVLVGAAVVYTMWDSNQAEMIRDKRTKIPSLHFIKQYEMGNTAPWDNILKKFTTDPNGLKDQVFDQYN